MMQLNVAEVDVGGMSCWDEKRIARLGFLIGLGWSGDRVAEALKITPNNVYRQASRLGLFFRESAAMLSLEMPEEAHLRFEKAARKRSISRHDLARNLLIEIAKEPILIDNVLDDNV